MRFVGSDPFSSVTHGTLSGNERHEKHAPHIPIQKKHTINYWQHKAENGQLTRTIDITGRKLKYVIAYSPGYVTQV